MRKKVIMTTVMFQGKNTQAKMKTTRTTQMINLKRAKLIIPAMMMMLMTTDDPNIQSRNKEASKDELDNAREDQDNVDELEPQKLSPDGTNQVEPTTTTVNEETNEEQQRSTREQQIDNPTTTFESQVQDANPQQTTSSGRVTRRPKRYDNYQMYLQTQVH